MFKYSRIFFVLFLSLCVADVGSFAATARRGGGVPANNGGGSGTVAARAATRTNNGTTVPKVKNTVNAVEMPGKPSADAARAGKKQTVKPMAARAGATQKVIQTGSKVATAASNSAVPQECQDAFYGCMDSFCMLDNASGGRCQCNDKITELDKIQDEILKMDKQSYIMATEGVERIQMGDAEEQVMDKSSKMAAGMMSTKEKASAPAVEKKKNPAVAWGSSLFDDDSGEEVKTNSDDIETFADKKGDVLYKSAAKMCINSVPEQCKQYSSIVQLTYAQRIKSDCVAYENSLKQQKSQSKQKLQTAQKALRDAATEEFQNQNKYGTAGECAVAFAQCMQNEAGCGSDYTGCVTMAAKENVKNTSGGAKAKQTKIKGAVAGSDITLAALTMESLLAKKEVCQKVVKQCVNANKNDAVWTVFLRNAAPALKSAEEMAEQNLRMQCIPTVAECYKTACKSTIDPNDKEGSYDMCLSNPETYKSLCKVQLEPCLEATGGTYDNPTASSLWNGLLAALKSMKVDACTKQITTCLKERCNDDYSGCVGLDTETVGNLCPVDKLTACVSDGQYADGKNGVNTGKIREYVAEIAQGLAVQIDNSMLTVCQKAVNDSMLKVCGDTETCEGLIKDPKIGASSVKYEICQLDIDQEKGTATFTNVCKSSLDQISDKDIKNLAWGGQLTGLMHWGHISYDFDKERFITPEEYIEKLNQQYGGMTDEAKVAVTDAFKKEIASLENTINSAVHTIESDPIVTYCMTGREVQGFKASEKIGKKTKKVRNPETGKMEMEDESASRFPKLTEQVKQVIIAYALKEARDNYDVKYGEVYEQLMKDQVAAAARVNHEAAVAAAKSTCETWAANSVLPRSPTPPNVWAWVGIAFAVAAAVVATVFTAGAAAGLALSLAGPFIGTTVMTASELAIGVTAAAASVATVTASAVEAGKQANRNNSDTTASQWHAKLDQWNYKAAITTSFNEATGECTKETVSRQCTKPRYTSGKCRGWGQEKTETKTMKLL